MTGILKVDQWKDSGDNALMTSDGAGNLTVNVSIGGFSSTGIDDNATSTAITIDSSGEVLVGTTSTDNANQGVRLKNYGLINGTATSDVCLLLNRKTTDGTIAQFRKDNVVVGSIDVNSSGISINLGGTGSANALDDYEEGTWSPVFLGGGSNPTVSYLTQEGRYTKIGNLVYVQAYLLVNTTAGGSGNLRLGGLPFTAINASSRGFASIALTNIESTIVVTQVIDPNSTYSILRKGNQPPAEIQVSDLANGEYLWYSGVYQVS